MHAQFRTYRLNEAGQQRAEHISEAFSGLLTVLEREVPEGYQLGLCRSLLEQASFHAKKGMSMDAGNQAAEQGPPATTAQPSAAKYSPPAELLTEAARELAEAAPEELAGAAAAYGAYNEAVGGKSAATGAPLPNWEENPNALVKVGWLQVHRATRAASNQ